MGITWGLRAYEKASAAQLAPHKLEDTLAFMFESRHVFQPTQQALRAANLQPDYDEVWSGFTAYFRG
jgi:homogentisate 1,2-dioxygenase